MKIEILKNQLLSESIREKGTVDYEYVFKRLIDVLNDYFPEKTDSRVDEKELTN
jgi:hypothetical protein